MEDGGARAAAAFYFICWNGHSYDGALCCAGVSCHPHSRAVKTRRDGKFVLVIRCICFHYIVTIVEL